ncbi:MAG: hypothetical protein K2X53_06555 [Alphaproteobacteria bacterium]|nr:hypothetical protein [Alphaproteobacteria bacterium]
MYLEQLIRKVLPASPEFDTLDFIASQGEDESVSETLVNESNHLLDLDLKAELSPPDHLIKRLSLRPVERNPNAFQLSLKVTGMQPVIRSFYDAGLLQDDQSRASGPCARYQAVQVFDEKDWRLGGFEAQTPVPMEVQVLNQEIQPMLYHHSFLMPPLMSEFHCQHMGVGEWLCESNLFHHGGRVNTFPIIPYAGFIPDDFSLDQATSLFAVPHLLSGHAFHFKLMTFAQLKQNGFLILGGLKIGAFHYALSNSYHHQNETKSMKEIIESGAISTQVRWPAYEEPFTYISSGYRGVRASPHLLDVCFKRSS